MNVLRRLIFGFVTAGIATVAAVFLFPEYGLTQYVTHFIGAGTIVTVILTALSFHQEDNLTMHDKTMLMNGFLIAILIPSFYTAGAFVHESQTSWSKGEIHYHADFEVMVEENGELSELNLIDPGEYCKTATDQSTIMCKLNDRAGLTEYHEHNDDRIHLEGTFKTRDEASLRAFFQAVGGDLTNEKLIYPTNEGVVTKQKNGGTVKILVRRGVAGNRHWCAIGENVPEEERCEDSFNGEPANSPSEYVISPYSRGPNLDDIFVIYDSNTVEDALSDVREDGKYKGRGLTKEGSGYGG